MFSGGGGDFHDTLGDNFVHPWLLHKLTEKPWPISSDVVSFPTGTHTVHLVGMTYANRIIKFSASLSQI